MLLLLLLPIFLIKKDRKRLILIKNIGIDFILITNKANEKN